MRIGVCVFFLTACLSAHTAFAAKHLPKILVAKDGRTFVTENGRPFVPFGVTYYRPGTGWAPQVWKQFDGEATRKDFARMKGLGVNCVRVFLSYGSFYHEPGKLDPEGLAKFDQFLAIAEEAGIYVHPTGPDLWEGAPSWSVPGIGHEEAVAPLETFWKLFIPRYKGRNVIFAYDLRNEPEVEWESLEAEWKNYDPDTRSLSIPSAKDSLKSKRLLDFQTFREFLADEWTRRQAAVIKSCDPKALVTVGMIQWSVPALLPGIRHYSAFRPERQARYLDFLTIHFYPLEDGGLKYLNAESEARNLSYLESVMRAVAAAGKPVVLGEFGWYGGDKKPTFNGGQFPQATEEQQAHYDRGVVETSAGLVCGWLNWGLHDQPEANDCSQQTGLLTADDKDKAWGKTFQKLAAKYKGKTIPPKKLGPRPNLDWDACLTSMAAEKEFRKKYYEAFRR